MMSLGAVGMLEFLGQPHPRATSPVDSFRRDVAQPGRALAWGARGRQFKSARPDQQPVLLLVVAFLAVLTPAAELT
jgi:hypothetical protein